MRRSVFFGYLKLSGVKLRYAPLMSKPIAFQRLDEVPESDCGRSDFHGRKVSLCYGRSWNFDLPLLCIGCWFECGVFGCWNVCYRRSWGWWRLVHWLRSWNAWCQFRRLCEQWRCVLIICLFSVVDQHTMVSSIRIVVKIFPFSLIWLTFFFRRIKRHRIRFVWRKRPKPLYWLSNFTHFGYFVWGWKRRLQVHEHYSS